MTAEVAPRDRAHLNAVLRVTGPDGVEKVIVVEAKSAPIRLSHVIAQLRQQTTREPSADILLVAPYLSPRTRTALAHEGIHYADATGNLRLALDAPALFIETVGATRDPWPDDVPLRSLRGPGAGRAVRAFCDFRPPYGIRQLAERSGVAAATLSRVAGLLEREDLLQRERSRGRILDLDWEAAIRRWIQDYRFSKSNITSTWLEPRGMSAFLDKLRTSETTYAVTGSLAATLVAPVAVPRLAAVYVENVRAFAAQLRLRQADTGANVILVEPYDPVVFARNVSHENITYTAYSQVAADLLTGSGRWPAEGEALLTWMAANEDVWRS